MRWRVRAACGRTCRRSISRQRDGRPDILFNFGTPTATKGPLQSVGGETVTTSIGNFTQVDITFNGALSWTSLESYQPTWYEGVFGGCVYLFEAGSRVDLPMVATHEVGHALGLKHDTTHNKSVMQPEANLSLPPPRRWDDTPARGMAAAEL